MGQEDISEIDLKRVLNQIEFISSYTGGCDDWVTIKKEVMKSLPSGLRSYFSRRDPITKEQRPNKFEKDLIIYYHDLTGIELKVRKLSERREIGLI